MLYHAIFMIQHLTFSYFIWCDIILCYVMICDSNRVDQCRQAMVNRTIRQGAGVEGVDEPLLTAELTIEGSNANMIITLFVKYGGVKQIKCSDEK